MFGSKWTAELKSCPCEVSWGKDRDHYPGAIGQLCVPRTATVLRVSLTEVRNEQPGLNDGPDQWVRTSGAGHSMAHGLH